MAEHWQQLVANFAVVALFIAAWAQTQFAFRRRTRREKNIVFGLLIGAGVVSSIVMAVPIGATYVDLRLSLIAVAAFFGGPVAAILVVIFALTYRAFLGGRALVPAGTSIVVMAVVGVVLSRATRERVPATYAGGLLAFSAAAVSLGLSIAYYGRLTELSIPVAILNALATALSAFFIMRSRVAEREQTLLRSAFLHSPDYQYVKTTDGRFAAVNEAVAHINGFASPAEMLGKTDFDLTPESRAIELFDAEQKLIETGEAIIGKEETLIDRAGDETWYSTTKVPLRDDEGIIIGLAGSTRDVTAKRRLRMEAEASRNQLDYVLTEITCGVAMFDRQGTLAYCNARYSDTFPLTSSVRRSGQHIRDILLAVAQTKEQKGIPAGREAAWIDSVANGLSTPSEQEIELFDGRWMQVRTRPTDDGSSLVVVTEITNTKRAEVALLAMTGQLKLLAMTDGLTGLTNRRALDQVLDNEVARHHRGSLPLAILMIDVDQFKVYNDLYGHLAGDKALKVVATCLKETLKRPSDIAARYGGEEFAAVLPGTDEDGAFFLADEFRERLRSLVIPHAGSKSGVLSASVGMAMLLGTDLNAAAFLGRADEALYDAKQAGRDRVMGWRQKHPIRQTGVS